MNRPIFLKATQYCAYQERTQDEVRQRLAKWQVYGDEADEIIAELIQENFLNEERFARTFAGSKFRVKKWGKRKIMFELKQRRLTDYCIRAGMAEIDPDDYYATLKDLLRRKQRDYRSVTDPHALKRKLAQFALTKGYENDLVWEAIKEVTVE